jgi:hypothetical protein
MTEPSLEAFVRRISRQTEQVFNQCGRTPLCVVVDCAHGSRGIIEGPHEADGNDREAFAAWLRDKFQECGAIRYAVVMECWYTSWDRAAYPNIDDAPLPSEDPARKEQVVIWAGDKVRTLAGLRDIIRPEKRLPYLGKLTLTADGSGRFDGLLMSQVRQ